MKPGGTVIVSGGFDDIRSRQLRFLEEAAKLGEVTVLLWPDEILRRQTGKAPAFPLAERLYFLQSMRYITRVVTLDAAVDINSLPKLKGAQLRIWVDEEATESNERRSYCKQHGLEYRVLSAAQMSGFPPPPPMPSASGRKKVVVSGSYDWFHSGHVRFFEEASSHGDLYVIVGHDANIQLLKGEGHPLIPEQERRYIVGSIKYVKEAIIATGHGWLDAVPDIERIKPDIYAVNEDGDRGGKREYCEKIGLEYLVLKRTPAPGLPRRSSTDLRGF